MNLGSSVRLNRRGGLLLLALAVLVLVILVVSRGTGPGPAAGQLSGKRLLVASILAARRGGVAVKEGAEGDDELNVRLKGTSEPVTDVDVASHCAMFYGLKSVFPRLQLRSEERPPAESCKHFSRSLSIDDSLT